MIDRKYTLLSKEVRKTDDARRAALDVLKRAKAERHEAKIKLFDAKGIKKFYVEKFDKLLNLRKQDKKVRQAYEQFEDYSSSQEEIIADLNNQKVAAMVKSRSLKAKVRRVDPKRDFTIWKKLKMEIKELEDLNDALYFRIGLIRREIAEEKVRVETELFKDDLEFREARVELDDAKLELACLSREYGEKIEAQKSAVAAYEEACKKHNAAVTELWQHMMEKRTAKAAM